MTGPAPVLDHHYGPDARDERNRAYRVRAVLEPRLAASAPTVQWRAGPLLDQGQTGHCGGFGAADEAGASPVRVPVTDAWAHAFYYEIKDRGLDQWGREDGTSVQAVMTLGKLRGLWKSYAWPMSMVELDTALDHGPVIVGTSWRTAMFTPNRAGLIRAEGQDEGGHCYVLTGRTIHPTYGRVYRMRQSWGEWGLHGNALLLPDDVASLVFGGDGEAAVPLQRTLPRPTP